VFSSGGQVNTILVAFLVLERTSPLASPSMSSSEESQKAVFPLRHGLGCVGKGDFPPHLTIPAVVLATGVRKKKSPSPAPGSAVSWGGAETEGEPGQLPTQPGSSAGAGKSG